MNLMPGQKRTFGDGSYIWKAFYRGEYGARGPQDQWRGWHPDTYTAKQAALNGPNLPEPHPPH